MGRKKLIGAAVSAVVAAIFLTFIERSAALDAAPSGNIFIPFQLQPSEPLNAKLTEAVALIVQSYEGEVSQDVHQGLAGFARLILVTSSVERSPRKQYSVLYATFSDLFTIIQHNESGAIQKVFLINGDAATFVFGQGKIPEEADMAARAFKQRPSLQRAIGKILEDFPEVALPKLQSFQTDKKAARSVVIGLLSQVKSIDDYRKSPCRDIVERYRTSEAFALRFVSGKRDSDHMIPAGLIKIGDADVFAFEDDSMARSFALIEVSTAPACRVKAVRTFFSY